MIWVTWCRKRSGDDSRRQSAVGYTTTSTAHAFTGSLKQARDMVWIRTLCGRFVGLYPREKKKTERLCSQCVKRLR